MLKRFIFLLKISLIFAQDYHVIDFNATGDGKTDDTLAVRAASAAAANSNGGRLIFDAGYTFLTGAFNATSNVVVDVRGTILASQESDEFHYPIIPPCPWIGSGVDGNNEAESGTTVGPNERQPFIFIYNATNITLTGGGTVDGQGNPWWECSWTTYLVLPPCNNISRPMFIRFMYSSNVQVHDITLKDPISWTLHLAWVTQAHIYNVNFTAPGCINPPPDHLKNGCGHNGDGIDVDCSTGVLIENCVYQGSDDAVTVISGKGYNGRTYGRPSENVLIRNFTMFNSQNTAMSIGSGTSAGIRNVTYTDIYANGTASGIRIKYSRGNGGVVEDLTFNNFQVYNVELAVVWTTFAKNNITNATATPKIKNVKITNLYVNGGHTAWDLNGLPESPVRDVFLSNITVVNIPDNETWRTCKGIDGFCDNSSVTPSCPPCLNADCPTNWYHSSSNKNQCFYTDSQTLAFSDAQTSCILNVLSSLASIDNAFVNGDVVQYVNRTFASCQKVYIGLQRSGSTWTWINGDNSTYRNWEPGYPTNDPNASCAVINLNDGKWANEACTNKECSVCAFELNNFV